MTRMPFVRIPETPGALLWMAAEVYKLRAASEARGEPWPSLEEECQLREAALEGGGR